MSLTSSSVGGRIQVSRGGGIWPGLGVWVASQTQGAKDDLSMGHRAPEFSASGLGIYLQLARLFIH